MPGKITLKYKKTYYQLLKKENLEKIKKILKKRKYLDRHIVDKITLEEKEGLPYLYLQVDSYEHLIDRNPGYIEDAMKYNSGACTIDNIQKSIEFELKKIFLLEVPAIEFDYENGEQNLISFSDGVVTITRMPVNTKENFVLFHIADYIGKLEDYYRDRFPGHEELIGKTFKKEVNKQGKKLFGKNAMTHITFLRIEVFALSMNTFYSTKYEISE